MRQFIETKIFDVLDVWNMDTLTADIESAIKYSGPQVDCDFRVWILAIENHIMIIRLVSWILMLSEEAAKTLGYKK